MDVVTGVLLLMCLVSCWTITKGMECPLGWKPYKTSCYYFSHAALNWNQAFDQCIILQGYLVEIDDSEENEFIASVNRENSYNNYYIGLSDRDKEGTWKWMTSGKPLGFSFWDSGEPNNHDGREDCGQFNTYPSKWNDEVCSATFRYICEKANVNECSSNPCLNGGSCIDGINRYTCNCVAGYKGTTCQNDIDECQSSPCQHGSTCDDKIDGYTCTCPGGYEGTNCEAEVNECLSNPCHQASTCFDGVNSYLCVCDEGFKGPDCHETIECSSNPCLNGATCIEGVKNHTCECEAGYNGTECENDINDCLPNPCKNGGKCVDGVNSYTCSCVSGYRDIDCTSGAWNDINKHMKRDIVGHLYMNRFRDPCTKRNMPPDIVGNIKHYRHGIELAVHKSARNRIHFDLVIMKTCGQTCQNFIVIRTYKTTSSARYGTNTRSKFK